MSRTYPLFVKRDLDGFFGLLIDNLVQLLLVPLLCAGACGMSGPDDRFIYRYILPGAAVSILIGNVFYAWQAHRLAARTGRSDITALPYGLNTPSLLVYIFFVMAPAFERTKSAEYAWKMGLFACIGSGAIEFAGAFVATAIRRHTPRAALLSTLAGIAIGFISMAFALRIFHRPLVAMLPLAVILISLFSRAPFPLRLPGGLVAILLGTFAGWVLPEHISGVHLDGQGVVAAFERRGIFLPIFCGDAVASVFRLPVHEWLGFLSVIVPMGLFNVVGSLQNIESADAAGDSFNTFSSMAMNGVGTIAAALFGSCFPTTIYIGHPGWKDLGARAGYSTLNGLVISAICLSGTVSLINAIVPIEAGIAIVLWVGIIITAQAFQATPDKHAPAVAMGLFPAIAAWGATVAAGAFIVAGGVTLQQALTTTDPARQLFGLDTEVSGFLLSGLITVERGYIFTCMILASISALLIDRKFYSAALWALSAAMLTALGLIHSWQIRGNEIDFLFSYDLVLAWLGHADLARAAAPAEGALVFRAFPLAAGYVAMAAVFAIFGWHHRRHPDTAVSH